MPSAWRAAENRTYDYSARNRMDQSKPSASRGPPAGIRAPNPSRILAGRWADRVFADLGAKVIKVKPPLAGSVLLVTTPIRLSRITPATTPRHMEEILRGFRIKTTPGSRHCAASRQSSLASSPDGTGQPPL